MAGIRDEQDVHALGNRRQQRKYLVIDDPLPALLAFGIEARQQENLIEAIFLVAGYAFGLLAAMPGIGDDQPSRLPCRGLSQAPRFRKYAFARGRAIEQ